MFARPLSLTAALLMAGTAFVVPTRAATAATPTAQASSGTQASPRFSADRKSVV